jgi:hypothetical protein
MKRLTYFQRALSEASFARRLDEKVEIDFKRASFEASPGRRSDKIDVQENPRASSASRSNAPCQRIRVSNFNLALSGRPVFPSEHLVYFK